jgi:flavin reductase (DIM6/NTAB) family NADH-FMN oxidoreductase RutF
MMINPSDFSPNGIYHLMTQMVIPRPIAWALTQNLSGNFNLAPFSYFNGVSSAPPLLMLSIGKKASGEDKDTRRNLKRDKKIVIHIPTIDQAHSVQDSSDPFDEDESEIEALNLAFEPWSDFPLPRLKDCAIALGCELYQHMEIGDHKQGIFFVEIKAIYIKDALIQSTDGKHITIDLNAFKPLTRLGNSKFSGISKAFKP